VYLLRCDSKTTAFAVGEAEVTDVAWMPIHTLESKLKTGDPNVVPRTPEYQTAFFQKLREEYNYAGSAPVR